MVTNSVAALTEHELFVERKRSDAYNRNATCRAICTIKRGLRMPGAQKDGKAFVPENWDSVFRPVLGAYLKFLLSRPDQFRVVEGSSPGLYTIENVTMNKTVVAPPFFAKGKVKGLEKGKKGKGKEKGKNGGKAFGGKSFGKEANGKGKTTYGKGKTVGTMFSQIHGGKGKVIKGKGKATSKTSYLAAAETEEAEFEEEGVEPGNDDEIAAEEMPEGVAWADQVEHAMEAAVADGEEDFEIETPEGNLEDMEDEFDVVEVAQEAQPKTKESAQEALSADNVFNWEDN